MLSFHLFTVIRPRSAECLGAGFSAGMLILSQPAVGRNGGAEEGFPVSGIKNGQRFFEPLSEWKERPRQPSPSA